VLTVLGMAFVLLTTRLLASHHVMLLAQTLDGFCKAENMVHGCEMQVLIVLGTAFVLLRTRLLASYHVMPLNKLLLGLGLVCGGLGYLAISKIGGRPQLWLALWWAWIGGQCTLIMNLGAVYRLLHPPPPADAAVAQAQGQHAQSLHGRGELNLQADSLHTDAPAGGSWADLLRVCAKLAFVLGAAIWFPLSMGCAPFDRSAVGEIRKLLVS